LGKIKIIIALRTIDYHKWKIFDRQFSYRLFSKIFMVNYFQLWDIFGHQSREAANGSIIPDYGIEKILLLQPLFCYFDRREKS